MQADVDRGIQELGPSTGRHSESMTQRCSPRKLKLGAWGPRVSELGELAMGRVFFNSDCETSLAHKLWQNFFSWVFLLVG